MSSELPREVDPDEIQEGMTEEDIEELAHSLLITDEHHGGAGNYIIMTTEKSKPFAQLQVLAMERIEIIAIFITLHTP